MFKPDFRAASDRFLTKKLSGTIFTWRQIWGLLLPGVLDSLSIMFINSLITALISKNGESSVAAVSLVFPITGLIINLFNGISAGGTVVVAQSCGKDDSGLKKSAISMTLWLTVVIGLTVCIPFLLFPDKILYMLYPHAESLVMEKSVVYLTGCIWSIIVFTVYTAVFAVLRGLGESKRCLILTIIINVSYLIFSFLFLNIMSLDIRGSVLALFLARFLGAICAVFSLFVWHPPVHVTASEFIRCNNKILRSILHIGTPLGFEQMFISLSGIVSGMYMVSLGTAAIATNAIVNSLLGLLYSPGYSVGSLSVTVVGRCFGAGKYEEAKMYGKRCNQIALILLLLFSFIFYPLLPLLLKQYNPSPETYEEVRKLLYLSIPALFAFWPAAYVLPSTLRAANDALFPSVYTLIVLWLVNIGLGYLLAIPLQLGLLGVWISVWATWMARSIGFTLRFHRIKWSDSTNLIQ